MKRWKNAPNGRNIKFLLSAADVLFSNTFIIIIFIISINDREGSLLTLEILFTYLVLLELSTEQIPSADEEHVTESSGKKTSKRTF